MPAVTLALPHDGMRALQPTPPLHHFCHRLEKIMQHQLRHLFACCSASALPMPSSAPRGVDCLFDVQSFWNTTRELLWAQLQLLLVPLLTLVLQLRRRRYDWQALRRRRLGMSGRGASVAAALGVCCVRSLLRFPCLHWLPRDQSKSRRRYGRESAKRSLAALSR